MTQVTRQFNARYVDLVLTEDIGQDAVVIQGNIIGVALTSGVNGQKVTIDTEGVKRLHATTSAALVIGDELYWDSVLKQVTASSGTNTTLIGTSLSDKSISDTEVDVKLHSFLATGSSVAPESITASSSDTFTNKEIDANTTSTGNVITNIGKSEIESGIITDQTAISTIDVSDIFLAYDTSGSVLGKATIQQLLSLITSGAVTDTSSTTFSNKSLDADNNTIRNIGSSEVKPGIITGHTQTTLATNDIILFADTSAGHSLRNTTLTDLISLAHTSGITLSSADIFTNKDMSSTTNTFALDATDTNTSISNIGSGEIKTGLITDQDAITTIDVFDYVLAYDASGNTLGKVTIQQIVNLDSGSGVTAGSAATFTNKKIDADGTGNVITNIGSLQVKAELISGQTAIPILAVGDYVLAYDTSGTALGKVTIQQIASLANTSGITDSSSNTFTNKSINADNNTITNIGSSEVKADIISGHVTLSSLDAADELLLFHDTTSTLFSAKLQSFTSFFGSASSTFTNKIFNAQAAGNAITNIGSSQIEAGIITGQSAIAALTGTDYVLVYDLSGTSLGKATIQQIVDLGTGSGSSVTDTSDTTFTNKKINANATGNVITNIGQSEIESGIITDQTAAADVEYADKVLIFDDSTSALGSATIHNIIDKTVLETSFSVVEFTHKKIDANHSVTNNFITNIGKDEIEPGIISNQTLIVTLAKTDYILAYDLSGTALGKVTVQQIVDLGSGSGSAITASSVTEFTNKTIIAGAGGNVITNIGSSEIEADIITGQTLIDTLATTDYMLAYDLSGTALGKVTVQQIVDLGTGSGSSVTATSATEFTNKSIDANNTSTGNVITNIGKDEVKAGIIADQTAISTLTTADFLLAYDLSGTALGKVTIQQIVDLGSGSGSGITAASSDTFSNKGIDATTNDITNIGADEVSNNLITGFPTQLLISRSDQFLILDITTSELKKTTLESALEFYADEHVVFTRKEIDATANGNVITNIGASQIEPGIITAQPGITVLEKEDTILALNNTTGLLGKVTLQQVADLSTSLSITPDSITTFKNKKIDALLNTITNIGKAEIKAGIITEQVEIRNLKVEDTFLTYSALGSELGKATIGQIVELADASGVTTDSSDTFTNKSINAADNNITNIGSDEVEPDIILGQSSATIALNDSIMFIDANNANGLAKGKVQDLINISVQTGNLVLLQNNSFNDNHANIKDVITAAYDEYHIRIEFTCAQDHTDIKLVYSTNNAISYAPYYSKGLIAIASPTVNNNFNEINGTIAYNCAASKLCTLEFKIYDPSVAKSHSIIGQSTFHDKDSDTSLGMNIANFWYAIDFGVAYNALAIVTNNTSNIVGSYKVYGVQK